MGARREACCLERGWWLRQGCSAFSLCWVSLVICHWVALCHVSSEPWNPCLAFSCVLWLSGKGTQGIETSVTVTVTLHTFNRHLLYLERHKSELRSIHVSPISVAAGDKLVPPLFFPGGEKLPLILAVAVWLALFLIPLCLGFIFKISVWCHVGWDTLVYILILVSISRLGVLTRLK